MKKCDKNYTKPSIVENILLKPQSSLKMGVISHPNSKGF